EGRLGPRERETIAAHLEDCRACLTLVGLIAREAETNRAAAPEPTAWTLARGGAVGRYVILGPAGRGGMSEVYAAYDPELDRKVALKLLRTAGEAANERAGARLLRE